MVKRYATAIVLGFLAVGCAGQVPISHPYWAIESTVGASHVGAITVDLSGLFAGIRRVASVDEIESAVVTLREGVGTTYTRTVTRTEFNQGKATLTFTGLTTGPASIMVDLFDASGTKRGMKQQSVTVLAGTQPPVRMVVGILPKYDGPPLDPASAGQLQASLDLVDGPVMYDEPVPEISPMPYTSYTDQNLIVPGLSAVDYYMGTAIATSKTGKFVICHEWSAHYIDSGDQMQEPPEYKLSGGGRFPAFDAQENLWLVDPSKKLVLKFDTAGRFLFEVPVTGTIKTYIEPFDGIELPVKSIDTDPQGNAWVADGNQVTKISPAGSVLGTFPVGAEASHLAIDPSSGVVWVTHRWADKVTRFAPDGTVLSTTVLGVEGDIPTYIRVDASGHAWISKSYTSQIAKIGPDGSLIGHLRVPTRRNVLWLGIDKQGNLLANTLMDGLFQIAPDGTVLKHYGSSYATSVAVEESGSILMLDLMLSRVTL